MDSSKRTLLKCLGIGAGASLSGVCLLPQAAAAPGPDAGATAPRRPWFDLGLLADPIQDSQLLFLLGGAWDGTTDVAECLETAARIDRDDVWSWPSQWTRTAERLRAHAEESLASGHRVSAGQAFLRSSSYFRAALLHHPQPRHRSVRDAATASRECFERALVALDRPARPVAIAYEGTTLPGYLFEARVTGRAPVLIVFQGRDAWAEDTRYLAEGAVRRGYHCLALHGPGQGLAVRLQGLTFRPDWERVIGPAVDWLIQQPGVDAARIGLLGLSMGGALAPRAAAFEKRIRACVANPGVYSWADAIEGSLARFVPGLSELAAKDPRACDAAARRAAAASPLVRWWLEDSMWKHGVETPSALLRDLRRYTNAGVAERISCRMLVVDGAGEAFSPGEARRLYKALRCPKDFLFFAENDPALTHCQAAARAGSSERMFDWLDRALVA